MSDDTPRCATCRWWIEETDPWDAIVRVHDLVVMDLDTYEPVPGQAPVRFCRSPALRRMERPADDGASVLDGSGFRAVLATGPAFGCVHHEPRDT